MAAQGPRPAAALAWLLSLGRSADRGACAAAALRPDVRTVLQAGSEVVSCSHFAQPAPPTSAVTLETLHAPADRQASGHFNIATVRILLLSNTLAPHANRRSPSSLLSHSPVRFQLVKIWLTALDDFRNPQSARQPSRRAAVHFSRILDQRIENRRPFA